MPSYRLFSRAAAPKLSAKRHNPYLSVFLQGLLVGAIIFIPFLIYDKGYFLYYGDFNAQQIPFYKLAQDAIKNGEIFWNWNTDLGSNFIGSYSFYLLGSPFFYLTLLFPNQWVPLLMAPLLILKTACAAVTSFAFLKRFTATDSFAQLGAMLYAFSGFSIYNIFFNHFHEAMVVFPLLLVALEETVVNGRKGWFALTVALAAVVNYFFFVGQVVFVLLYFCFRCFCKDFPITWKKFFVLGFEAVIGLLLSCFLLVPSLLAITGNDRVDNFYTGMDMLFYRSEERYGLILESLFFPPDIPARPNFFPDSNSKWSSVSAYLPLFSMTGVAVFFRYRKGHWAKRLLTLCGAMALIPVLNSAFYAFNSSYYARWFYMPVLIMSLVTCLALEDESMDFRFGLKFCAVAVAAFSLIGIIPSKVEVEDSTEEVIKWFSIPPYPERFWAYVLIAIISLLLVWVLITLPRRSKRFIRYANLAASLLIVCYSIVIIGSGKSCSAVDIYDQIVTEGIYGSEKFDLDTGYFYRVDEHEALDNMPMLWDMPTIQCFHSIVPPSVMKFYQSIGVGRDVASRPEPSVYALRGLTSVKYLFCRTTESEQPEIPGFTYLDTQNNYNVYENEYFVPMGFTYDYYVSEEDYEACPEDSRANLMMKALYLSDEDAQKYSDLLQELPDENRHYTPEAYLQDCEERRQETASEFTYNSRGFTAKITLERENLVFFSVPYEEGWTAEVNGEPVDIVPCNVGFMAVKAPEGTSEITFHYMTPGLKEGCTITLMAFGILLVYLGIILILRSKYPERFAVHPGAHRSYVPLTQTVRAQKAYYSYLEKLPKKQDTDSLQPSSDDPKQEE